jgi:RNA recognition motif-containing protein
MSEDNKFVLLTENTVINYKDAGAWDADSDGEQGDHHHRGGVKQPAKMSAWGNVPVHNVDEAPSLSSIFEEETQKAKQAKQKQPQGGVYRAPKGGPGAGNRPTQPDGRQEQYGGGGGGDFNRAREKIPVPNEPPFNAFVGNLSFDVAEADLQEFFGELGTNSIKIMREEDGKPRGYAYIEFKTKDGLSKALLANGSDFHGRHLNMDVAKPPRSATNRPPGGNREFGGGSRGEFGGGSRGEFGGGSRGEFGNSRGEFGSSRGEFGSSDKERYDTNWGPSANKPFNSFNNRPSGRGSDMRGPGERPRLNINPPKPSAQATELHDNISKPKGSFENPFGTANLDHKKNG